MGKNKLTMNKFSLSVSAFVCAGFLFTGCNKDDNGLDSTDITAIDAKVENGNNYNTKVDVVKAMIWVDDASSDTGDGADHELASGDYTKGGFTIDLPKTVDKKFLAPLSKGMPDGITVSDTSVNLNSISFSAYKSGDEVGYFDYISQDSTTYAGYVYVDRNVKISGSGSEGDSGYKIIYKYDLSFKKGWNIMYMKETEVNNTFSGEATSKAPSAMKWSYSEYNQSYNYSVRSYNPAANKSISNRKPFFLFK
jgi:hypothetical protein